MDEIARVLICAAAAWRLASLIAFEDGPFDILERVRRLAGVPADGEIRGVLARLIICPWCSTVWFAPGFWIAWEVSWWIPGMFAAMAGAVFIESNLRSGR